ncbi:MAG: response regulator receiver modulated metal dependent phosphohydrolase [Thermoleophilia bacterium]|nr:response regulator receiver modulated metal dependent phosphohydrolase [Thermoleophilia bacterium]
MSAGEGGRHAWLLAMRDLALEGLVGCGRHGGRDRRVGGVGVHCPFNVRQIPGSGKRPFSTGAGGNTPGVPEHTDNQPADEGPIRVLIVDDDRDMREVVAESLAQDSRIEVVARAYDGAEAVRLAQILTPDVVIMDVNMPRLDGCAATERILDLHPEIRIVALTGTVDSDTVTRMILAGAIGYAVKGSDPRKLAEIVVGASTRDYFVDPAALDELFASVVRLAREERRRREEAEQLAIELAAAYKETITALVSALRYRDFDTEEHGDRVAERVVAVAKRLGIEGQQLQDIEYGAVFHDIGKIAVPDSILHNTDDLTEAEWDVIRQHTVIGEQIIQGVGFLKKVAQIVRHSHEHWDGSGYPDNLAGEAIPIESRIVFACDAFDAMTSSRSYQSAMTAERAMARLRELSGVHFDPAVVDALIAVLQEEPAEVSSVHG